MIVESQAMASPIQFSVSGTSSLLSHLPPPFWCLWRIEWTAAPRYYRSLTASPP